jgi:hypothetical protein
VVAAFSFCILSSAFCISAPAQDWTLSTADFRTEQVTLKAIDEKGVHVVPAGGDKPQVIAPEAFLQVDRAFAAAPAAAVSGPAAKFMLHLVGGDRVGGEPVKVESDKLAWKNAAVGELLIPLSRVGAMTKSGQSAPDLSGTRAEDVVTLSNGDAVRGIVTALAGDRVQVKTGGADEPVAVPLDSVVSVRFATTGGGPKPMTSPGKDREYRVRLADGSSLVGASVSLAGDKLLLAIGAGGEPRPVPLASVAGIEQVNGPVSWLTSRQPADDVQVPFVSAPGSTGPAWPTRTDGLDVAGQPIVVDGRTFTRALAVHAYSRVTYPLDGSFKAFRTRYGLNDSLVRADVTVRIKVGEKVVHEAKNVKPGVLSPVVAVDLPADAKALTLEVDYGQGIDVEDRLNWIEPALLRERPKAAAQTQTSAQ